MNNIYDFDRTEAASLTHDASPPGTVSVAMEALDGTFLEVTASIGQTPGTRVLNGMIALTP